MGSVRTIIIIVASFALAVSATAADAVRYTVSPIIENGALKALGVEMVLTGEADGETEIVLPNAWGGKRELWRSISEFRVSGDGMSAVAGSEPSRKLIRHAPNSLLTVRYRVSQSWAGEPAASNSNEYRPIIRPGYFQVIGHTIFAQPAWGFAPHATVAFTGFPKAWSVASDLEHNPSPMLGEVQQSVIVGGDFRVMKAGPLRVAIRGAWPFTDADFAKRLEPIIASHHKFWGDAQTPFLVTVMPLLAPPGHTSIGGTGLGDAFVFFATTNADERNLTRILAHEHLHSWIPRRIGAMPEPDATDYWLSEGFTDFYTVRLLVRDGMWTAENGIKAYNDALWAYAFSPARNYPNDRVAREFWSDFTVNDLTYKRGFLFAALADDRVRRATNGAKDLDDVVFGMRAQAPKSGIGALARDLLIANMKALEADPTDDIDRFITKGETIVLPGDSLASCGAISTGEVAEFDRGFDGMRTIQAENLVRGVDPEGPAYKAGLRNDMRILKLDLGVGGDSRSALAYQVLAGGETREISYLPEGKRRFALQEIKLAPGFDRRACTARLGGEPN